LHADILNKKQDIQIKKEEKMKGSIVKEYVLDENGKVAKEIVTSDEPLSSVELKEDSKGVVHPTVKIYNCDPFVAKKIAVDVARSLGMEVEDN